MTALRVVINGDERDVPAGTTLDKLVGLLGLAAERLAVELNLRVVRRPDWERTELREGDRVEIVHFVGGG
ncbi:MAG TPA: sulfur carrier protein ThiS [Pyrinomonadaceae bacterium]|nr:sulfur carrier protein ThiS [Pyrinomonadaceae bacterium]